MLRPGFPRLSHPGVAHAISSIAFIAQGYRGRARRFLHDLGGKADRSTATGASTRSRPPQTQVVDEHGELSWKATSTEQEEHCENYVLLLVRVVRNNLFHGGKYPTGVIEDTARNEALLEASITILSHCRTLNHDVHRAFEDVAYRT